MTKKRVAVIGAGASGLSSIKCCLDEGLEPVCFERTNDIGGLWRFQENPEEGRASIYKSVIINTSKEMMCFSDYPIPDHFPNFMHNSQVLEYFRMYAKEFDLLKHIQFKTTVCSVKKRPDFSTSGQWEVVTECEGKEEMTVFDGVLVCSGHHTTAHLPLDTFPGIEKFKGQYMHSRDYKNPEMFKGKRVIVIGIGNSGGDLAVETSHTAKQVFLSTRRGSWIMNRVGDRGYPIDILLSSRLAQFLKRICGENLSNSFLERKLNQRFDHTMFGLKPKHRAFSQHPTVNDDLPNRIISGSVKIKGNVKEFTETAAIFEDGSREDDIDAVIFATGYSFSFPFLEDSVKVVKNKVSLYKKVFPPNLERPTLAIIGLIQPLGAIMPISELQARWATQVFKGLKTLPSQSEMMADITETQEKMAKRVDCSCLGALHLTQCEPPATTKTSSCRELRCVLSVLCSNPPLRVAHHQDAAQNKAPARQSLGGRPLKNAATRPRGSAARSPTGMQSLETPRPSCSERSVPCARRFLRSSAHHRGAG
ncbi:flavin-containing monooxygenase 5 isoform X2 [Ochotona princeps]|uniref:flavin-containing monooxygenase 5 isoform X2 n=1 Tax=Ochotona princeps TaxID=9978 RepID=UPI0027154100|nr:flavin-containing monooxygenase 5 isoform X2 [Ochotona princeps]